MERKIAVETELLLHYFEVLEVWIVFCEAFAISAKGSYSIMSTTDELRSTNDSTVKRVTVGSATLNGATVYSVVQFEPPCTSFEVVS